MNMTQQKQGRRTFLRATQIAIASAAFALMAACGGGGSGSSAPPASGVNMQVVAFGTSLTDAGTYAPITLGYAGGRFTTNPGEVWAQKVSEYFGNQLGPAFEGGFGSPLTASGGLDYAQGGAQVTAGGTLTSGEATEMPIVWQIQQYLSQHGSFNSKQLVLVEGGANEILNYVNPANTAQATESAALGAALANPANLAAYITQASAALPTGSPAQIEALAISMYIQNNASTYPYAAGIITAAGALAQQVVTQIVAHGATNVALADVPDIGQTYAAWASDQQAGTTGPSTFLTAISGAYNVTLFAALQQGMTAAVTANPALASAKVVTIDTFGFIDTVMASPQTYGFTITNTATACNLQQMEANATAYAEANPYTVLGVPQGTPQATIDAYAAAYGSNFGSSLFCSPATLTAPNAPTTYMFADSVHPTTALHAAFANYVETQLAAAGIGKAPQ